MASYTHFSQEERCVLAAFLREGLSLRAIAKKLQRSVGGISMEISRGTVHGSREQYDPHSAHLGSRMKKWDANRKNPMKEERLQTYVHSQLQEGWSPEIIAGRLKREKGKKVISHETIYQWAYRQELVALLPRGKPRRQRRRHRLRNAGGSQGLGKVTGIERRPQAANARTRFGDWEGDTMLGKKTRGPAVAVQKERRARYVILRKLRRKSSAAMRRAITEHMQKLPKTLRRSLTLDRGTENAEHAQFGLPVFFCDAYASWQKGSVEQVIGLVRRYIPKGTDLRTLTSKQLKVIQDRLNNRPRKVLGFQTPQEVFSAHCKRLGVQLPA